MFRTVVADGETPQALSLRLSRPLCMILRANGVFSSAWLYPGTEINVPDADYCAKSSNACPTRVMNAPPTRRRVYIIADGETLEDVCRATGLPERCVLANAGLARFENCAGRTVCLPVPAPDSRTRTVKPEETLASIAPDTETALRIRALNSVWGNVYPGMKLLIPSDAE